MVLKKLVSGVKKLMPKQPKRANSQATHQPVVVERSQHSISRKDLSRSALDVLYHLHRSGYKAYLVGGGVRDRLLGFHPKDFDVVTDATPEQVKATFRNCRIVGRRFRIAHVFFGREIIEVATFRAHHTDGPASKKGMLLRDNVFGNIDEDAHRRDFTINALYYNIADFTVLDFVDGLKDIETRTLRLIGEPEQRYREDPVRMLRAIRLAAKLDLNIAKKTANPILKLGHLLSEVPAARLWDESGKMFLAGHAETTFNMLEEYGLLQELFKEAAPYWQQDTNYQHFIQQALRNTDNRIQQDKSVHPAFMFAVWLYPWFMNKQQALLDDGCIPQDAFNQAFYHVIDKQVKRITIPKRFSTVIREIWSMQWQLEKRTPKRAERLVQNKRFRASYDFLLLLAESELASKDTAEWWTKYQEADSHQREYMFKQGKKRSGAKRNAAGKGHKKPYKGRRNKSSPSSSSSGANE